jgi:hypothetical protein
MKLLVVLGLAFTSAVQTSGVKSLQPSPPVLSRTIDGGKLKGEPTQLAWSPDATRVFVQSSERDSHAMITNPRYFVLGLSDGKLESVSAPPEWATDYWRWKSDKAAPGSRAFGIDVKREERTSTTTSAPMGGALARGGADVSGSGGTTADDMAVRAQQMQKQQVISLTLKSEIVGEFVNQQFLPGYTFGWAPESSGPMIAYRNQAGRLSVMDEQGQKQEIAGTKDVILPAWSGDGSKIVFLQKSGKNKYDLLIVNMKS